MGTSANENIAFQITSTADLSGTTAARKDLGALGAEAAKVEKQFEQTSADATRAGAAIAAASKSGTAGLAGAAASAQGLAQSVQFQIGAFEALGKKIDVGNGAAVQGYRAQGDALSANLVKLGATDAELNRIGSSIAKVERAAGASMLDPRSPQAIQLAQLPSKARTAANAVGVLSQAAVAGTGSLAGMATAAGNVATGLASISTNAKIAAGATGIGVLITLAGVAYGAFEGWQKSTRQLNEQLRDLESTGRGLAGALAGDDQIQKIEQINRAADKEIAQLKDINFHGDEKAKIEAQINANRERAITLANTQFGNEARARAEERQRLIDVGRLTLNLEEDRAEGKRNDYQLALQQNEAQRLQRALEIDQQFQRRSSSGEIIKLTNEEIQQRAKLLDQNDAIARAMGLQLRTEQQLILQSNTARRLQGSDQLTDRVQGRLEEIELERAAEIKRTGDVYNATLDAEQKKRQLYRETYRQAADDARTIIDVLNASHSKEVKAFAAKADSLRRFLIGAQAAHAGVEALIEGGKAIGSLAVGDLRGAALHGSAALSLAKAAAIAGQESLGGGRSYASDSGGGGSVGSTFRPQEREGGGVVNVYLLAQNAFGEESMQKVSYYLQRRQITNKPIVVPPTSGLIPVMR